MYYMDMKKKLYLLLLIKLILVVFNLCSKNIDIFSILPLSELDALNLYLNDIVRGFIYSFQDDMATMSDGPDEIPEDIDPSLPEICMSRRDSQNRLTLEELRDMDELDRRYRRTGPRPTREQLIETANADRRSVLDERANVNWLN